VADRVAVLLDGTIAQESDPAELYGRPASLPVATFVGEAVVLEGTVEGELVRCLLGTATTHRPPPPGPVSVVVRPEQVQVVAEGEGVGAVVGHVRYLGHDALLGLRLADGTIVESRVDAVSLPAVGTTVGVTLRGPVSAFPR
jgi:iron(III) transport system ATP-binding protein